jgi:hypothetical protein
VASKVEFPKYHVSAFQNDHFIPRKLSLFEDLGSFKKTKISIKQGKPKTARSASMIWITMRWVKSVMD